MRILKIGAALLLLYVLFLAAVYLLMRQPPETFAMAIAKLPRPLMMAFPFEPMWLSARAGSLTPGQPAPDFELERHDRSGRIRLSSYRGSRPVVLVFGSYT